MKLILMRLCPTPHPLPPPLFQVRVVLAATMGNTPSTGWVTIERVWCALWTWNELIWQDTLLRTTSVHAGHVWLSNLPWLTHPRRLWSGLVLSASCAWVCALLCWLSCSSLQDSTAPAGTGEDFTTKHRKEQLLLHWSSLHSKNKNKKKCLLQWFPHSFYTYIFHQLNLFFAIC